MKHTDRAIAILGAALALALTGCTKTGAVPDGTSAPTPSPTAAEPAPAPAPTPEPTLSAEPEADLFPRNFSFASGAGGWSTELDVAADGSFTGQYHDSDMGTQSVYYCNFHGTFSQPVKVNDYTYSMRLETIQQEGAEGDETLDEDGTHWIVSYPYGLDDADEIFIYLPGAQRQDLPEGFVNWTRAFDPWDTEDELSREGTDKLLCYGLYNAAGDQGFVETGWTR